MNWFAPMEEYWDPGDGLSKNAVESFPLLPIHLLWINLVTDGLPGLALLWKWKSSSKDSVVVGSNIYQ